MTMDLKEVLETRRAVNFFDPSKDVDESVIRRIYDLARLAPTSFNLQPVNIILLHSAESKQTLREAAFNQPKITDAPWVAILLGDKKAYDHMDPIIDDMIEKGFTKEEGRNVVKGMAKGLYEGDNERAFAHRNVSLFASAFMLAAKSLGVDTHPMDGFDGGAVRKVFNIPDDLEVVMLVAIGHHDESKTLLPRARRKEYDEVVRHGGF